MIGDGSERAAGTRARLQSNRTAMLPAAPVQEQPRTRQCSVERRLRPTTTGGMAAFPICGFSFASACLLSLSCEGKSILNTGRAMNRPTAIMSIALKPRRIKQKSIPDSMPWQGSVIHPAFRNCVICPVTSSAIIRDEHHDLIIAAFRLVEIQDEHAVSLANRSEFLFEDANSSLQRLLSVIAL